jgi:lipopolysaccharide export system protein LptA
MNDLSSLRLAVSMTVLLMLGISAPSSVRAEKADSEKPLTIAADRLDHDDVQQISIYSGKVILTKGTIILRGDKLVLRKDPAGYQFGTVTGKLASFRQKREGLDEFIEGYGAEINYNDKNEVVRFVDKATVRKLEKTKVTAEIQGNIVRYDSRNETFTVESGGGNDAAVTNPGNRVRVVIQPKSNEPEPKSGTLGTTGSGGLRLQSSPSISPSSSK